MNIEHLHEFIELSRQLNFTSAAKKMHITQPALSNHIQLLEKETGVLLIERASRNHARLTPAGQCFLDMATKVVSAYDEALPKMKELQENVEGKITIRLPRHEYSSPLLDYIFEFQKKHPLIDIVISPWDEIDGVEDVSSGAIDCAYIGYGDHENEEITKKYSVELVPYTFAEILLWVDKSHPLAHVKNLSLHDLDDSTLLIPANKKHESWMLCMDNILKKYKLTCEISEKYCDSLEDLALTKTSQADLLLCDGSLLNFPPIQLRKDRVAKHFDPKVNMPVTLGYKNEGGNQALQRFVDFLYAKYQAEKENV